MIPTDPRAAIALLPYLLDADPHDQLLVAGFDRSGTLCFRSAYPLGAQRPLDEPLLDSSLWPDDIEFATAVAYSEHPSVDLRPLADAWGYRGRTTTTAAWAGPSHWRSYLCLAPDCCSSSPQPYAGDLRHHEHFDPLHDSTPPLTAWRRTRWDEWRAAIALSRAGKPVEPLRLERLARSLHDIPIRDAVLAHSADVEAVAHAALVEILQTMANRSMLGSAIPAHTCLAAMHYLSEDLQSARNLVRAILTVEEYSLARLLHNGLDMRAPASLLARSFAHFSPLELLAA